MARRVFHFVDGNSRKFWAVQVEGSACTVQFGKIGTAGQTQVKSFASDAEAQRAADKLIGEKTRKGYTEVADDAAPAAAPPPPPAPAAAPPPPPAPATAAPPPAPAAAPPPAPATAAPPPATPAAVNVKSTLSLGLGPDDLCRAVWRGLPTPPRPLPTPVPFDLAACRARAESANGEVNWWWPDAGVKQAGSASEAWFWFHVFTGINAQGTQTARRRWLASLKADRFATPPTVPEMLQRLTAATIYHNHSEVLRLLYPWLAPASLIELFCSHPALAPAYHTEISWQEARWLAAAFLPHLDAAGLETFRAALRRRLAGAKWPDDHTALHLAVVAGLHDELLPLVERWQNEPTPANPYGQVAPIHVVLGLASAEQVEFHFRRLRLRLYTAEEARLWLAVTECRGLDVLRDALLAARDSRQADELMEVLAAVQAPEAAVVLLDLRLQSKFAGVKTRAHAALEAQPENAIAGLVGVAAERGKRGEAAVQFLRDAKERGHAAAIATALATAAPEVQARVRQEVLERVEPTYEPLRAIPDWLATPLAAPFKKSKLPDFIVPGSLPPLLVGGQRLSDDHILAVLAALRASTLGAAAPLVQALRDHADRPALAAFAWNLFQRWLDAGAPAKEKWAFLSLAPFADDAAVLRLTPLIRAWPGENQHQRAVTGLEVLGAVGSDLALMQLNGMAQKLKFKALQERARGLMDTLAAARGLTREQLEDRIVPDFDLDADGGRIFDFGPRQFRLALSADLEPMVRDESGKVVKDLPKPGARDDAAVASEAVAAWKLLKKQLRETFKVQALRLEQAMVAGRRWPAEEFDRLLVRQPVLTHLTRRLLWAGHDDAGALSRLFRVSEDGAWTDADGRSCPRQGLATVSLPHPLQLTAEQRRRWGEVFAEYEILPPFAQLHRPIHTLAAAEAKKNALETGSPTFATLAGPHPAAQLRSRLEDRGWRRVLHDHGGIEAFSKHFLAAGVTALVFIDPGILLGYADNQSQTLTRIFFVAGISDGYVRRDSALPLAGVDAIAVSELLYDLTAATTP